MFESIADFRTQASRIEADLLTRMGHVATLVDPPFTPAKRRKIHAMLRNCATPLSRLRWIWTTQMMTPQARALPFGHADRTYFSDLDIRLRLWGRTEGLLRDVLKSRPLPLIADEPDPGSPIAGQLLAYQRCFERLHGGFSPTPPDLYSPEIGRHGDLPYPFTGFFRLMQMVRRVVLAQGRPRPVRFLDVGCGVGLKLVQAAQFFEEVQGLEFDPARAAVAEMFVRQSGRLQDRAFCADALEFDGYGDFDVIYAYKPLSDPDLLQRMEQRIIAQARPGTILILPYFDFDFRFETFGCSRIYDKVFITGGAGQDLAPLLGRVGQIGTVMPDTGPPRPGVEGFAGPVRDALRHWGHLA
ncbi:MAG: class I SAM-dependent methyltransferase [Paracoccaceae bacterium]